ncbi:hypothetical protein OFB93_31085, partial [Escherichia coli]|nr:hypothetical protein [Escherichia coli]
SKKPRYFYDAEAIAEPAGVYTGSKATFRREASKRGEPIVPGSSAGSHRPQYRRALEIFEAKGLTEAHLAAIRAVGFGGGGH